MTAVVVDDEPLARSYLEKHLKEQGIDVIGHGESGVDALDRCESLRPDILFLDIQMPDLTGLQAAAALEQLPSPPLLVFVTGYSEHAVQAFEHAAFDYLLKPVAPDRLAKTVSRAELTLQAFKHRSHPEVEAKNLTPLSRLPVKTSYAVRLIRVEDIDCAVAREKKVYIRCGETEQKTYYTLTQLEHLLPAEEFMRIHASALVRLSKIEELNFLGNHTYSVTLTGGTVVPVGRAHYADLQRRLGL